ELRYQHAADVRSDLKRLKRETDSGRSAEPKLVSRMPHGRFRDATFLWMGALSAAIVVALFAVFFGLNVGGVRDRLLDRGARPSKTQSIAVLPLVNLSGDPLQEYFADGMTDELTTRLSNIGALRVISRTSVMHFKGTKQSVPEIARELNVDVVLEGSVLRPGDRARI